MDYNGNVVAIVYQEQNGTSYHLKLASFYASGNDYILGQNTLASDEYSENYTTDANPVIGWGYNGRAMIVWERKTWPAGLYYKYCAVNYNTYFTYSEGYIQNSTGNSTNPTIYHNKNFLDPTYFHLAWEEKESTWISKIKYEQLYADVNNNIVLDQYNEPSYGSGYSKNYRPIIVGVDLVNLGGRQEYERLIWIGYRETQQEEDGPMGKVTEGGEPTGETKLLHTCKSTSPWSPLTVWGDKVESININKGTSIIDYWEPFAIAWSEVPGSITNKYVRGHETPLTIRTLNTTGRDLQINNSTDYYNLYVNSFSSASLPYAFNLSESLSGGLSKTEAIAIFKGREGVVTKDSTDFYYAIGDITLNGEIVDFIELPDTVLINNLQTMNEYLISEPFSVTSSSSLTYGVQYGIIDSAASVAALMDGSEINFRVELFDNQTGELLGVFDNITFSSENILQYNNIGYQVNLTGIGNRSLVFKLIVATNAQCDYSISNRFSDSETLNKGGYKQVSYKDNLPVTEYLLAQNYPNPFNPTTTIKYQLPKAGNVTLKVYDILGSEVSTLVDEFQNEGRFEMNFNASNLASGVYVYRLQTNEFVDVKKMVLLR